ncbi:iron ABC transporter permease [Nocardia puris]|nr:iron ABC transporter permease [Nocardia puris]
MPGDLYARRRPAAGRQDPHRSRVREPDGRAGARGAPVPVRRPRRRGPPRARDRTGGAADPPGSVRRVNPSSRGVGLLVAGVGLAAACLASVLVGRHALTPAAVFSAFTDFQGTDTDRIVRYIRVPRTVAGLLAGAALALAGAVMQGLTRNPLAGPGLLGINAGASLAIVAAIGGLGMTAPAGLVWFAFLGAAVAAVFVYTLGSLGLGGATPVKLVLAGAAFTALCGSVTTAVTLLDRNVFDDFRFWVVGSLSRADTETMAATAPFVAVGAVLAVALARALNALAIGDDMARTLGARLATVRAAGAVSVVLLAGSAVAIAGPIGFVGLVVPHVARAFAGQDYRWVLAWCAVLGPALLLLADVLGRVVAPPQEIQAGIVTALAGSPFFLYLVRNRKVSTL